MGTQPQMMGQPMMDPNQQMQNALQMNMLNQLILQQQQIAKKQEEERNANMLSMFANLNLDPTQQASLMQMMTGQMGGNQQQMQVNPLLQQQPQMPQIDPNIEKMMPKSGGGMGQPN